jgi:DNA-binding transcriptional regulator YdaS (Cro superfamily)
MTRQVQKRPEREEGLQLAIEKAGGFRPFARALGIAPSSLSGWKSIPSYRILQVEMLTGIKRETLRPDLYRQPESKGP